MTVLLNFVSFQAGWFACVLGAAHGLPWAGTLAALGIVAVHLARAIVPQRELMLLLVAGAVGTAHDAALSGSGAIAFAAGPWIPGAAPYWMAALWLVFATTLNVSLAWLRDRLAIAALAGSVGGPLAYFGGAKLGALELVAPVPAMIALAIGWAALTPLLLLLARRFDGYSVPRTGAAQQGTTHA